jgi:hypothetical protein
MSMSLDVRVEDKTINSTLTLGASRGLELLSGQHPCGKCAYLSQYLASARASGRQ